MPAESDEVRTLMPTLRGRLQQYLHGWRADLPEAWRAKLNGVQPDYAAIPPNELLRPGEQIVPVRHNGQGVFYALEGIDPSDVKVAVVGNDPYPDPSRATGRSFEQGNLAEWDAALDESGCVTASLLSLACAAAALHPSTEGLELDCDVLTGRRGKLRRGLQDQGVLLPPHAIFNDLTRQGVLWLNRTPTISTYDSGRRYWGSTWRAIECQRNLHQKLWSPVTCAIVSALLEEARARRVIFVLFGGKAKKLRSLIRNRGESLCVPEANLSIVESGHPSAPKYFFQDGNPLRRINDHLTTPIDWCVPVAGQ